MVIQQRELARVPFHHQSPQMMYRKTIINYLKSYSNDKSLSYSCLHLAVYMLDVFMDNHTILPERLHLVANVCLWISAKFEEVTVNIPKLAELNFAVNNRYSLNDYKEVEIIILKYFHWYLMIPTAAHYTHYYMQVALSSEDYYNTDFRTLIDHLQVYIEIYLDKVIEDIHFMQVYKPSRLAAAIISAARTQIGLCDWTSTLEKFTEYSKQQIYDPLQALLQPTYVICSNCQRRFD
ncbi:cyclin-J-like isoform X2 [Photinus pyralis]|nr:cyclin-J-like isoform X2 [Photinus pyralis]XP_031350895.1 cyclin-J-like isoform X2 [Photinus pyralis]